ncbi:hypothetical protein ANANG_G00307780, partial [Anguilla anguilla]
PRKFCFYLTASPQLGNRGAQPPQQGNRGAQPPSRETEGHNPPHQGNRGAQKTLGHPTMDGAGEVAGFSSLLRWSGRMDSVGKCGGPIAQWVRLVEDTTSQA